MLGAGFAISRATAYRYAAEGRAVLAARPPQLCDALERGAADGGSHLILDGTVVDTDRCSAPPTSRTGHLNRRLVGRQGAPFGGAIQAVMRPDGLALWVSAVEPGSTHALTAAHAHPLGALSAAAARGLPTLADGGDPGAGQGMHTPIPVPANGRRLDPGSRTCTLLPRALRALGERGFALPTQRWWVLQHVTACPHTISDLAKAALVLTHVKHRYLSC